MKRKLAALTIGFCMTAVCLAGCTKKDVVVSPEPEITQEDVTSDVNTDEVTDEVAESDETEADATEDQDVKWVQVKFETHSEVPWVNDNCWTYEYDDNGRSIKEICSDTDGNVTQTTEREYDENDNEIKTTYFEADGSIRLVIEREFSDDGKTVNETHSYSQENFSVPRIVEYDEYGNEIKSTSYDTEGNISQQHECTNEYNADGILIRMEATSPIEEDYLQISEFDSYGNCIRYYSSSYGYVYENEYEYEYDSDGNILKSLSYTSGGIDWDTGEEVNGDRVLDSYTLYEYDEHGNNTKMAVYNPDDEFMFEYVIEYEAIKK